jgi:uncharacterized protein YecE (DUF72 family)
VSRIAVDSGEPPCLPIRIGLAGWSEAVSKHRAYFPTEGTGLTRYSATFDLVEVNASFYRAVRAQTFASWAEQTPATFGFSVKINRSITHAARLSANAQLEQALEPMASLGDKLLAVLVQLPPTLAHDRDRDAAFLVRLRSLFAGMVAWEPRHPSWEDPQAQAMLAEHGITTVLTTIPEPDTPRGAVGAYVRLHGTPRRYSSAYSSADLAALAEWIAGASQPALVVFDNTASSAGVRNALELRELLG